MPATLDKAFRSPYHYGTTTVGSSTSGTQSIRNAEYDSFQQDYQIKSISDIQTEADDIKSIYNGLDTLTTEKVPNVDMTVKCTSVCERSIQNILKCNSCRLRLKSLLEDDDNKTVMASSIQQKGGAGTIGTMGTMGTMGNEWKPVLSNLILGIILIIILNK